MSGASPDGPPPDGADASELPAPRARVADVLPSSETHSAMTAPSWPLISEYLTSRTTSQAEQRPGDETSSSPATVESERIERLERSPSSCSCCFLTHRSVATL